METHLIDTMEEILNNDIKEIRKHTKKFEKHTTAYEKVEKANSNKKNTKKAQIELLTKKSKMQVMYESTLESYNCSLVSGLTLIFLLNSLQHKKKYQFIESMAEFILHNLTYFEKGYEMFKQMESAVRGLKVQASEVWISK
jgi:Arf-GAP/coiled-coil/ANK repeat/PH domain-containing protein